MNQLIAHTFCDRYQVQSLLGRSKGRRTFLARDLKTDSLVVVKLVLFGPDFTWDDLKLFEREGKTLQALNHPKIPQYLDSFEVETEIGNGFALVQTYIEARSLQAWIDDGRHFSEAELKAIAIEILQILDYLHSQNPPVIHRDIKPSNILLSDRSGNSPGQISLVDFGSVQTSMHSGTITIVGTYGYMPPEQFRGQTGPASDLYSLGMTIVYLLTGNHPADLDFYKNHIQFNHDNISKIFKEWLEKLTFSNLSSRYSNVQGALQQLEERTNHQDASISHTAISTSFNLTQNSGISRYQTYKHRNGIPITAPGTKISSSQAKESDTNFSMNLLMSISFIAFVMSPITGLIFSYISYCSWQAYHSRQQHRSNNLAKLKESELNLGSILLISISFIAFVFNPIAGLIFSFISYKVVANVE